MKSIKVMSIIGLIIAVFGFLCITSFNNVIDYEAGIGWGIIIAFYLVALSIVGIATSGDVEERNVRIISEEMERLGNLKNKENE